MNSPVAQTLPAGVYLASCLAPFRWALADATVTDVYVNRPGEMWIERLGGEVERIADSALTESVLDRLVRQVAALSHQGISRESPLLSATLPDGSRLQVVAPPATRGPLALAIRRQTAAILSLGDYTSEGHFDATTATDGQRPGDDELRALISERRFGEALGRAVRLRRNIIVAGGTSTGKTTFLNALLREIDSHERLILIEDTPELQVGQPNTVGLVAVRGTLGEAAVTASDLVSASLRMRPDRIILGELRGREAFAFLRAINSGHPGSMTTIHADSPAGAIEQLVLLVLEGGTRLSRDDVRHYIDHSVDLFVQLTRDGGRRRVASIVMRP